MTKTKKGTLIIALRTEEGNVVMASDTLESLDVIKLYGEKIINKKGILMGDSGIVSSCQAFEENIKKILKDIKENKGISEIRKKIRRVYTSTKRSYLESLGKEEDEESSVWAVEAILVFSLKNKLRILRISNEGMDEKIDHNFVAVGSGDEMAYAVSNLLIKEPPKLENTLTAAHLIVESVVKTNVTVGGDVDIWIYNKNGEVKHLTKEEIEKVKERSKKLQEEIHNIIYRVEKEGFTIRSTEEKEKNKIIN